MAGVGHAVVGVGHGADWHLEKELQEGREERTWSQRCGLGPETGVPGPLGWGCSLGPEMGVGPGPLGWGMAWATFLLLSVCSHLGAGREEHQNWRVLLRRSRKTTGE